MRCPPPMGAALALVNETLSVRRDVQQGVGCWDPLRDCSRKPWARFVERYASGTEPGSSLRWCDRQIFSCLERSGRGPVVLDPKIRKGGARAASYNGTASTLLKPDVVAPGAEED